MPREIYRNQFPHPRHGLLDVLRWKLGLGPREPNRTVSTHYPSDWLAPVAPALKVLRSPVFSRIQLTWIGHSTFLIQHRGRNFLTDPIFGDCLTPIPGFNLRRTTPAGLTLEQLPPVHDVLISHNHYDHLDAPTIQRLESRAGSTRFWLPSGLGQWFTRNGIGNHRELAWWESASIDEGMLIHSVPAQHFAARGALDRNRTHWCGWMLLSPSRTIYFAGDTGYCPTFREIGERFGAIDLAIIPIGAYRPRWLMRPMHVDPYEAVKIHQDVRARLSVAAHWGTFRLTDEPLNEPPELLRAALTANRVSEESFRFLRPGETITI